MQSLTQKDHKNIKVIYRHISTLAEYERNSKTHSDSQIAQIAESINEFGFTNPLLIGPDGVLIAGHGRLLAARMLGLELVPVIELSHLTETQRRAYVIADNKLAENSGWDEEALIAELKLLEGNDYNLGVVGFNEKELEALLIEEIEEGKGANNCVADEEVPEQYMVLVELASEAEQVRLLEELLAKGHVCKALTS